MKRTIITTVGTSLLTNKDRPWAGWMQKQTLPLAATVDQWLSAADPIKASAEAHTWFRLDLFDADHDSGVEVVLIHSHTPEGEFCAERLVTLAKAKGIAARHRQVDGLAYADGRTFNRSLRQLARVIGEEINSGRRSGTVELAATGGFKAEIAIANLVGAISDTQVHYIYESFASLVTIDPIPVTLRAEWISQGAGQVLLRKFSSAHDCVPLIEIESLLKQDEKLRLLINEVDDLAEPSLFGQLAVTLLDAPQESWPPASELAPATKKHFDSASHHRPRTWAQIVDTVARNPYTTSIRYESKGSGGILKEAVDSDSFSDLIHTIDDGEKKMTIRISTTATTAGQRRRVQQLLRKELKL